MRPGRPSARRPSDPFVSASGSPGREPLGELVEHVDVDGQVIEVVTRGEMRARTLRHRCTYVFVVRSSGRLVVHQRADWKSIYPGHWDVCFGGICGAGEAWLPGAERELAEEAGIRDVPLQLLGPLHYDAADGHIVGRAYLALTDEPVRPGDGEVVAVDEVEIDRLDRWLTDRPVCLDSSTAALPLLRAYARDHGPHT